MNSYDSARDWKFDRFARYYPMYAECTIEWRELGGSRIVCTLDDGSKKVFDFNDSSVYTIPSECDGNIQRKLFGVALKDMLREKQITQKELSVLTGISQVTISKYVTGKNIPSFYTANVIARALNCKIDDLVL